ncbi:hypothetical protein SAMN04244553_4622 [Nocardia amikacinitolerans]|uniref:Uncharacterized protein n=1 Tax=Nocardia amikacinitolerans TaxID=756689 RepID=A0A285LRW9_9NOCA|nr:hypothetical protein [Nocardia amikacinitolerans]SNY87672.1 hypothetical protein SAMN04244553_4622 [Nocardia amikacinitolerans]
MTKQLRRRVLTVGEQQYLWKTYHRHVDGCEEVLRLRRIGSVTGLSLIFRPDGERHIPDGGVSTAGEIWVGNRFLNLNMPGVVRAFVDAAVEAGWMAETRTAGRRDGWDLFDEAYTRNANRLSTL